MEAERSDGSQGDSDFRSRENSATNLACSKGRKFFLLLLENEVQEKLSFDGAQEDNFS